MKRIPPAILFFLFTYPIISGAQTTAVDYLTAINAEYAKISKEQWDYSRAVGHGKRARLVEKRRTDLLQTIQESKRAIGKMKPFNQKTLLRDSIVLYLDLSYKLIHQDYAKIVNMEEVAEQSYDAMEAYMLAKEMASEKEFKASEMASHQIDLFAKENNIKLIDKETKLGKKMEAAGKTFDYYNKVYLVFFKAYKQDMYLADALRSGDINSIEQNRNSLSNYATSGIEKLKESIRFENDETLSTACRQMLVFYKDEADNKAPLLIDYFTAKDKFEKIKTTFDKIKPGQRTNQNIETYNNAAGEMNAASAKYNDIVKKVDESSHRLLENWNKKSDAFLDTHIP